MTTLSEEEREQQVLGDLLNGSGVDGMNPMGLNDYQMDVGEKADDAVDYEDIELSDEEMSEGDAPTHTNGVNGHTEDAAHGYEDPFGDDDAAMREHLTNGNDLMNGVHEHVDDDLFGESEVLDLFGDLPSSPTDTKPGPSEFSQLSQPSQPSQPAPTNMGGLSLPSMSRKSTGLALPGYTAAYQQPAARETQFSPSASPPISRYDAPSQPSPPSAEEESDQETDPLVRLQRDLLKGGPQGEVQVPTYQKDMVRFLELYPSYEHGKVPRFLDLFPPKHGVHNGKPPLKAPKPVQPTKLSLDFAQDQERSFRTFGGAATAKHGNEHDGLITCGVKRSAAESSEDELEWDVWDEHEMIGTVSSEDIAMTCVDWDIRSVSSAPSTPQLQLDDAMDGDYHLESRGPAAKKQKLAHFDLDSAFDSQQMFPSLDDPERTAAKLARAVELDMNDPHLLLDEHAPTTSGKLRRIPGDTRRDAALSRDITRRYNISNDEAYELLKENHQSKVRSMLGGATVEHALPAARLQWPFYRVRLDGKTLRSFHRPALMVNERPDKEIKFTKLKHIKRKALKGRETHDIFKVAEDLTLGDNSSMLMLEYTEEAPMVLSNFGMGNRYINYYRKRDADDSERPKCDIGETSVLLTQDKSPFANFGHVDPGETVPTIQNTMYRAPAFPHETPKTDFLVGVSSTFGTGKKYFMRNIENMHTVGQQLPLQEIPGEHSRKVTDAAKKRLRAVSYRIYNRSISHTKRGKPLSNKSILEHLPGSDVAQNRGKMREFMAYDKEHQVWKPKNGEVVPDEKTLRSWIKAEDVCLLDSMQVGVQHLVDIGLGKDELDEDEDVKDSANIELQLAPWQATKNFLNATQGKAMLKLWGEGDPTGRGEGFNLVKCSMKGGFRAQGESAQDKMDAKTRKEFNGHHYNVAEQQKKYDYNIRDIWERQKQSLSSDIQPAEPAADDFDEPETVFPHGDRATPRSSFGTPAFSRQDDDATSQYTGLDGDGSDDALTIKRRQRNKYGEWEEVIVTIDNPKIARAYLKKRKMKQIEQIRLTDIAPSGDLEADDLKKKKLLTELQRLERNAERRHHREQQKDRRNTNNLATGASPSAGDSPAAGSDAAGPASVVDGDNPTPQKSKGGNRNKEGTTRKCANCGQTGHIKTNKKLCPLLNGTMQRQNTGPDGGSAFGAGPAPLNL